ncbi:SMP-30/gluconolactonase/LRE family protein [Shimia biformata]|uniref:SMP-30/gluconolactonase/LRE family protein n=1 Tax=Shimia biformata TaxID=1294299 RepID=UPI00194FEAFA|nr:SMP-30/gluconolactonase/LRE family protein [Shimia biformata]
MTEATVFDDRRCTLGEGPLWHPERGQLFWFDILGKKLLTRTEEGPAEWSFDEYVSAAGWVDADTLILASETALWRFSIADGSRQKLVDLEADNPVTRSNDGRADPQGGFWIGTMGIEAELKAGAIYRYYKGELRQLFPGISIPNAISFAPDGKTAYFTDTLTQQVMRQALDGDGWPMGEPSVYLDLKADKLFPDGAVVDADGNMWLAQWGANRVAAYAPDGTFLRAVAIGGRHSSCPAFGGADGTTLFCTTAAVDLSPEVLTAEPGNGLVFAAPDIARGQTEHRVIL